MSDLKKYIQKRKETDKGFVQGFDIGYEKFKIEIIKTHNVKGRRFHPTRNSEF